MEQYAIKKFAEAFEVFPKVLAENTGLKANEVLAKMYNAHQGIEDINYGLNLEVRYIVTSLMSRDRQCVVVDLP